MGTKSKSVLISRKREPVIVKLPSFPDAEVYMLPYLMVEEQRAVLAKYPNLKDSSLVDQQDAGIALACSAIKSWNLAEEVDGEQKTLEITPENLSLLPSHDVNLLCGFVAGRCTRAADGTLTLIAEESKKA